jgi:hypothetical protein
MYETDLMSDILYRFEYGMPVYRRTTYLMEITVAEYLVMDDEEMTVYTYSSAPGSISIHITVSSERLLAGDMVVARSYYFSNGWTTISSEGRNDFAIEAILHPYQWRAQWLHSEQLQIYGMQVHNQTRVHNQMWASKQASSQTA